MLERNAECRRRLPLRPFGHRGARGGMGRAGPWFRTLFFRPSLFESGRRSLVRCMIATILQLGDTERIQATAHGAMGGVPLSVRFAVGDGRGSNIAAGTGTLRSIGPRTPGHQAPRRQGKCG